MNAIFSPTDIQRIRSTFVDARKRVFDFTGTTDRLQYLAVAGAVLALHTASLMILKADAGQSLVGMIVSGWCVMVALALTVRRLRDAGWPLVFASLVFVPGINFIMVPILGAASSKPR
jgi:uncharacterized membrane protein YhaH (DUF805 family)